MKKKLLFGIVVIVMFSLVAFAIQINNKNITITKEKELKAIELGIATYNISDFQKDGLHRRCLISLSDFNLPCSSFINLTDNLNALDEWEESRINDILETMIERENRNEEIKVAEGQTTIISE